MAWAQTWGVKTVNLNHEELLKALQAAMQDPLQAEKVWVKLSDAERGAFQLLLASGRKMPINKFELAYGRIRKMGRGQIEREQPHLQPGSVAEGLFYRGLIAEAFEQAGAATGIRPVFFIVEELLQALPVHKTAYENIADEMPDPEEIDLNAPLPGIDQDELEDIRAADTLIVDDLTTLLAYLRLHTAGVEEDDFLPVDSEKIQAHLIRTDLGRLSFMLGLGLSAELITTQEGRAYPKRSGLQGWLSASRPDQIRQLVQAWQKSNLLRDLWQVPGLYPEPGSWPYDPLAARNAAMAFLARFVPLNDWWSISEFIDRVKAVEPDFQRPGSDYESWYIRNEHDEFLHGFESWDAVDGALLEYLIEGPMHWLGLVNLAEEAAQLTAYGRAALGLSPWPNPPEQDEPVILQDDGTLLVSRRVSRVDRFQVARFTTWLPLSQPYTYRLDAQGIQQAAAQGINTQQIMSFLQRQAEGDSVPPVYARLLDVWQAGAAASVSFERLLVLRTNSPEILDRIYNEPTLRRFLGAQLGPMSVVIRAGQEEALQNALGEAGIAVEILGG